MSKYKNIFLDLDDTLWDTRTNARESMHEIFLSHNFENYFESFDHYYSIYTSRNVELWNLYHHGQIDKHYLITERFMHPLRHAGIPDENYALRLNHEFLECTASKTALVPYALELLQYLHPKYRLFVLSNGFRDVQLKKLSNSNILSFFEKIIVSEDAGVNKPHPDIFNYALTTTNSRKSESIMVGDNPDTDIAGAYHFNMDQIFFVNNQSVKLNFIPSYSVTNLEEIVDIL